MSVRQVFQRARTPAGVGLAGGMLLSVFALLFAAWQLGQAGGSALPPAAGARASAPSVPAAPPPVRATSPSRPGGGASPGVPGRHSQPPGGIGVISAPGPTTAPAPAPGGGGPGTPSPGPSGHPSPQPSGRPSPSPPGPQPSPPPGQPCTLAVTTMLASACVYASLLAP